MYKKLIILPIILLCSSAIAKNDKEYKVFQFPRSQVPRIDGDFSDWQIVHDSYNVDVFELENTVIGVVIIYILTIFFTTILGVKLPGG